MFSRLPPMGLMLSLVVAACSQGVSNTANPGVSISPSGVATGSFAPPVAYGGTITIVEDSQAGANWSKEHLTVDVRLVPEASGRSGQFEDNGSTYQYEGSEHDEVHSTGCTVIGDHTMTGGGAFDSPDRLIWLEVDPGDDGYSFLTITITYMDTGGQKGCDLDITTGTAPGGSSPGCGAANELQGIAASDGSIDFSCTANGTYGESGGLIVTGSLTRH